MDNNHNPLKPVGLLAVAPSASAAGEAAVIIAKPGGCAPADLTAGAICIVAVVPLASPSLYFCYADQVADPCVPGLLGGINLGSLALGNNPQSGFDSLRPVIFWVEVNDLQVGNPILALAPQARR